jgi:hypothetical protein
MEITKEDVLETGPDIGSFFLFLPVVAGGIA